MKSTVFLLTVFALSLGHCASDVVLESFASPLHTWKQQNDPVMGGRSTGTFTVEGAVGVFDGSVVDVPYLKAPGFIKVSSSDSKPFADVSACSALKLTLKSTTAYPGYRVSFGTTHAPGGKFFAYGFKANFDAPVSGFGSVVIPFSNFSDYWDDATGDQIKTCQDNVEYCPNEATLKNMHTISIWAEGIAGDVHLEIKEIAATDCKEVKAFPIVSEVIISEAPWAVVVESYNNTCSDPVQSPLRYNMTNSMALQDFPFPVGEGESLADAVCCDAAYRPYAEPRNTYLRADVALFSKLHPNGTTTFYDSVCGIPLFEAPRGRTFEDFKADSAEHGWPSFRKDELIKGNSYIENETGYVISKCGTHLGSFLPDDKGDRWCLDLVCLSGSPMKAVN